MSITYSFSILKLRKKSQVNNLNDVVYLAECRGYALSTENENCVSNFTVTIDFDYTDIDPESFVSFDQINKNTIISWIINKEGVSSVEEISFIKNAIDDVRNQLEKLREDQEVFVIDWSVSSTSN